MKKDAIINFRISQELKDDFQHVIENEGFTMSQVIEGAMKDIVKRGYIPINIKSKIERTQKSLISIPFIKQCLNDIIKRYDNKVVSISLFGSYARGSATPNSDVDLFLKVDKTFSLFDLAELEKNLESSLGKKVDLVTKSDSEFFIENLKREQIILYER